MSDISEQATEATARLIAPHNRIRYAHLLTEHDWERGYIMGEAVTALCGHTWVPSRDPEKFPMCPECERLDDGDWTRGNN